MPHSALFLVLLGGVLVVFEGAAAADVDLSLSALDVKELKVEFVTDVKARVRGRLRCTGLRQEERAQAWSVARVDLDLPRADGAFARLPEEWWGEYTSPDGRGHSWKGWTHRGQSVRQGSPEAFFFPTPLTLRRSVLELELDTDRDEDRWIEFDRTLDVGQVPAKDRKKYRVVVGWTLHSMDGRFRHHYLWVEYGPFSWGSAPPCTDALRATFRRPTSFTERGVVSPEAVAPPAKIENKEVAQGEEPPPVPKRSGTRPSQLGAVDACQALEKTLAAWPAIARAQARANLMEATLAVDAAADVPAADLAALVARVAAQAAAALDWVQSVQVTIKGAQGSTQVTCSWDAIVAYAKKETTLAAFHATWTCKGDPLPAPPADG